MNNKKSRDGLYMYFSDYEGHRCGPIELDTLDDMDDKIEKYRNLYSRYLIIKKDSINGDESIAQGDIEPRVKRRKRGK